MEVMEMDLSTFCATTHRIKIQFQKGNCQENRQLTNLPIYTQTFFGMFTGSYQEAMLSDFYIDED